MLNAPHKMPVWTKMPADVTDALDVNNNSVHKLNNKSSKYNGILTFFILTLTFIVSYKNNLT